MASAAQLLTRSLRLPLQARHNIAQHVSLTPQWNDVSLAPRGILNFLARELHVQLYLTTQYRGANRGLGLEFVRQLLSDSSNTVIGAVRSMENDLSELKALDKDGHLHIIECDTSSSASISKFADGVAKILGKDEQIHYLLNNAGINAIPDQTSLDLTETDLQQHISINVFGPAKTVQVLLPHLQKGTVVMNMTSGLGSIAKGVEFKKCATYSISKAALNMLTVQQAGDLKNRGMRVICMDPGWVQTRMGGEGALLEPHFSISSMLKVIHGLKDDDTAKFYTYTGEEVPW